MTDTFKGRDLIGIADLSAQEFQQVLARADQLKRELRSVPQVAEVRGSSARPTLALIFEKPSLRTRVTFEVAISQLGGQAIYLAPADIQLGKRESVQDVAANLSRWVDAIAARTFSHATVTGLAEHASVPVINALSDLEHPCQALADLQTIGEVKGKPLSGGFRDLSGLKLVFVGDGNNVANSLLLACARTGMHMTITCPEGYGPDQGILARAKELGAASGCQFEVTSALHDAVRGADAIYTDVWTSMGQEAEAEVRRRAFGGFQVNAELLALARPDAIVLHCMPAHRGEEITSDVLDGPQSAAFEQAENRLHAQKAWLSLVL